MQQIFDRGIEAAARCGGALRVPASVVIDELGTAVGEIPNFPTRLNTMRSRRISVVGAVQSIAQLYSLYGIEAESVLAGFSSKIFFPNVEPVDAEYASQRTGAMTARIGGTAGAIVGRRVFLPDEISRPRRHPSLGQPVTALMADAPPVQVYLTPSYRLAHLRDALAGAAGQERPCRAHPLTYEPTGGQPKTRSIALARFTDTDGWNDEDVAREDRRGPQGARLGAHDGQRPQVVGGFQNENRDRPGLVLRLAEELQARKATITEFFFAYVYSNTDNIQANLHYLDYTRLKNQEERKKKEAAAKARADAARRRVRPR